ncbi:MAG: cytochrome c4 [Nitrosomonas sp.]|nr:cytochrome c4 [Nitrosomonas sp.]
MSKKSLAIISVFALALSAPAFTADDDDAEDSEVVESQAVEEAADEEVAVETEEQEPEVAEAPETPQTPTSGKDIAAGACAGCHGADGNSIIPNFPSLAGQQEEYLLKQLQEFKAEDGEPAVRHSDAMTPMVAGLSIENMEELAAFYSSQEATPGQASDNENLVAIGKVIYHGGNIENGVPACASCHGPTGKGIPPHYPALAGQHAPYTLMQLDLFNKGERTNDDQVMQQVLTRMSGIEKQAVSAYIQGMR